MTKRLRFATQADRDLYVQRRNTRELAARQAYELANMSPHIRPEHYAQCITQTVVRAVGSAECDILKTDARPANAERVQVVFDASGNDTGVRVVVTDDPRDAVIDDPTRPKAEGERVGGR